MPRSPEFTGSAGIDYAIDLPLGALTFNANLYYTTEFFFDSPKRFSQDAYELLNLRATYTTEDEHWSLSIYGNNLTDTKYRIQVLPGDFAIQQVYGEPASVGASIGYRF